MNGKNGILAWIKQNPYKEDIHESLSLETRSTSGPHFEGSTVLREKEIVSYDITLLNKLIIACAKDPIFYKKEKTDIEILKNNNEILFKIFDKRPGETKLRVSPNKDVILLAYGDFPQRLDKTPSTNNKLKYCLYDIKTDKFIKEIVSIDESKCLSNFDISFANDNTLVFLYSVGGYNALPMFSDFRRLLITRIPIYKL